MCVVLTAQRLLQPADLHRRSVRRESDVVQVGWRRDGGMKGRRTRSGIKIYPLGGISRFSAVRGAVWGRRLMWTP